MNDYIFNQHKNAGIVLLVLFFVLFNSSTLIADDVSSNWNNNLDSMSLQDVNQFAQAYVPPTEGLVLKKTAQVYQTAENGRQIFQLDLRAEATSNIVITKKPADIVFVFDNSSSLSGNTDDNPKITRKVAIISGAAIFVENLSIQSPDSNVAVVHTKSTGSVDETTVTDFIPVGTDKDLIIQNINNMTTNGSNVVARGLDAAYSLFNSYSYSPDRMRIIIVLTGSTAGGPVMADMIQWSALLKGSPDSLINPSSLTINNQNGTGEVPVNVPGSGAIIYSIGIFSDANTTTNEYLWRVSSNINTSETVIGEDYVPNDPGSYYLTTNQASGLNAIFSGIEEQMGITLDNAVVKDYIDPRFDVVDVNGNIISIGSQFLAPDGQLQTLNEDQAGNMYVEWPSHMITPESYAGAGDAQIFTGNLLVKPKENFIGGNNVSTNISNSTAVYVEGYNVGSFPNPLVNVPFILNTVNIKDTIFLGELIPRDENTARAGIMGNTLNFNYPEDMILYSWGNDGYFDNCFNPYDNISDVLKVSLNPVDVINFTDADIGWLEIKNAENSIIAYRKPTGEIYYPAVGTTATNTTAVGTYDISVVKGTLNITKAISSLTDWHDPNQTFVFEINRFEDADRTILLNTFYETIKLGSASTENSATIINLPKGFYEITEKSDWSWRYTTISDLINYDTLGINQDGNRNLDKVYANAAFENQPNEPTWLTSDDRLLNTFIGKTPQ